MNYHRRSIHQFRAHRPELQPELPTNTAFAKLRGTPMIIEAICRVRARDAALQAAELQAEREARRRAHEANRQVVAERNAQFDTAATMAAMKARLLRISDGAQ